MARVKATTTSIRNKTTKSGKTYLYIQVYDERLTAYQKSSSIWISTGLEDNSKNRKQLSRAKDRIGIEGLNDFFTKHDNRNSELFIDYIKRWIKAQEAENDAITIKGYKSYIDLHIIPYFEPLNLLISEVTAEHLEGYYHYKAECGRMDGRSGGLTYASLKRHKAVINQVFKDAVKKGRVNFNPSEYVNPPKNAQKRKEIQFYTVEEVKHLLDLFEGRIMRDIIYVTFVLGLRLSEVMGLRWEAIDFKNNTLKINHTRVTNGNLTIAKDTTKTKSSCRQYIMPTDIRNVLLELRMKQEENRKLFGNRYVETGYVFVKEDGSDYYPKYPQQELLKMIRREGLPHKTFHALRHGCVTALLDKAQTMKDISEWVGHSSIQITMDIYAHIDTQRKAETARSMEGLLG